MDWTWEAKEMWKTRIAPLFLPELIESRNLTQFTEI